MVDVRCDCGAVIKVTITGKDSWIEDGSNSFSLLCVESREALAARGEISTGEFECSRMNAAIRHEVNRRRR